MPIPHGLLRAGLLWLFLGPVAAVAQTLGTVNFDFDSDRLDATARGQVAEIAARIKGSPGYKPTVVVGYTDLVGTPGYNDALGLRRARNVANALEANGVPVRQIGTVASLGERRPVIQVAGPARPNRRVTVSLSDILGVCRSYREIPLLARDVADPLQADLRARLETAANQYERLNATGTNTAAWQMAGAAREDCSQAVGYVRDSVRKLEYAKRCFCSSARMQVALGAAAIEG